MEEMYINKEILCREALAQIDHIVNDPAFIDSCEKAMVGADDRVEVVWRMLNPKLKPIVDKIVNRHFAVLAEAESRQSDTIN